MFGDASELADAGAEVLLSCSPSGSDEACTKALPPMDSADKEALRAGLAELEREHGPIRDATIGRKCAEGNQAYHKTTAVGRVDFEHGSRPVWFRWLTTGETRNLRDLAFDANVTCELRTARRDHEADAAMTQGLPYFLSTDGYRRIPLPLLAYLSGGELAVVHASLLILVHLGLTKTDGRSFWRVGTPLAALQIRPPGRTFHPRNVAG